MNPIQFHATVGPDQVIRPPAGVALPEGEIEVSVRRRALPSETIDDRLMSLCARRGLDWQSLAEADRGCLKEDLECEDHGKMPPRPGPGLFKGSILYMSPDFDEPLEDMKDYME